MILIYHILTSLIFLLVLPFLPLVWLLSEKRRANLMQRLGLFTGIPEKKSGAYRIWVHALSVGEVNSSLPFVKAVKENIPHADIVFTASTRTGFETAKRLMSTKNEGSPVSAMGYFPFDIWLPVIRVASRVQPDLICLIETDLWPGFLSIMKRRRVPVVLVNARLSSRSLKGYQRLGRFCSLFFPGLSHVMAQTQTDAQGFMQLGIPESRLTVTGNIKFDQPCVEMDPAETRELEKRLGIQPGHRVWIAGSTHEGEESIVANIFAKAKALYPDLKLVIAPRDPKRSRQLIRQLPISGYFPACLSDPEAARIRADILFIDTLGELARAYAVCEFAFIGGSLVSQGGHNPLEAAMFGRPILFGPHMTDFQEIEGLLTASGGAFRVSGEQLLEEKVLTLLGDKGLCKQMGGDAQKVFKRNSGALHRILKIMKGGLFV